MATAVVAYVFIALAWQLRAPEAYASGGSAPPSPSTSTTASTSSPADRELARNLFRQATELYDKGEYDSALDKYVEAYWLVPTPVVRLNIGRCLEKLNRWIEAVAQYDAAARELGPPDKNPRAKAAADSAADLRTKIPTIKVVPTPPSAAITIDGVAATAGVAVPVDPGTHVVVVKSGGKTVARSVKVAASARETVTISAS